MSLPTRPVAAPSAATGLLVAGLLVAWVDMRVGGFDVLPDVLGGVLVMVALGRMLPVLPRLRTARAVAAVAAVLSLVDLVHPTRTTTTTSDGYTTSSSTTAVTPEGLVGGLSALAALTLTVAVVLLCAVVAQAATARGELRLARRFRLLARWGALTDGVLALLGLTVLLVTGEAERDAGVFAPLVVALVVAGLACSVWVLLSLWQLRSWALLTGGVPPLPRLV